ncbi:hypothetical protein C0995_001193 [Termitomyces sp. Mi166|nr:hypothetical protein C0995_001193 [Termitomyces sp. Mi166\
MNEDTIGPIQTELTWDFYNADGPIAPAFSTFNESVELMAGPAEKAGNSVVDIVAINVLSSTTTYYFPASVPVGLYHYRINATINTTTSGGFFIQDVTARSDTVNVTTSKPIGCGKSIPPPYHNITSPSSPLFTSLHVVQPPAGFNAYQNDMFITWAFRDARNLFVTNSGISNVTVQVVNATTSDPIGPRQIPDEFEEENGQMRLADPPLVIGGTYKLVVEYRNYVQDGLVAPGDVVTHISEMFNFVTADDNEDDCAN